MATKTIAIMDDAYDILARQKQHDESFSDVIRRVFGKKESIMTFAGCLKISDAEAEEMKNTIKALRKKSTEELIHALH